MSRPKRKPPADLRASENFKDIIPIFPDFLIANPQFTEHQMRYQIRCRNENGLAESGALIKIGAVLPEVERQRSKEVQVHAFRMPELDDATRERLDAIERAVDQRTRLLLGYADAAGSITERPVRPLGLWFWGKVWTLVAWCELRDDFRMFRIDRITAQRPDGTFRVERGKRLTDFYAREGIDPGR